MSRPPSLTLQGRLHFLLPDEKHLLFSIDFSPIPSPTSVRVYVLTRFHVQRHIAEDLLYWQRNTFFRVSPDIIIKYYMCI